MNVVDSCGWLEYFAGGTNSVFFAPPIELEGDALIVPTLCLYEVFKNILVQFGRQEAVEKIAAMRQGHVVELDADLALSAAKLSVDLQLPMADSVILATARRYNAQLWTQDAHFEGIEDVHYCRKT
ncbi:MAG: type II toxin-antitoxin system VapC family toxin [Candidatus Hydrogenedentes bacterium]|nr:type II toxin-antitoxin system VapC family toxin [Candidatus Hydrogenedentota bacterium]